MNDIACQLRAQIASSTDPDRLERMAREAEAPTVQLSIPREHIQSGRCRHGRSLSAPGDLRLEDVIYITFIRKAQ